MSYIPSQRMNLPGWKAAGQGVRLPHNCRAQLREETQRRVTSQGARMSTAEAQIQRLTKKDLVEYLAAGIKPTSNFR